MGRNGSQLCQRTFLIAYSPPLAARVVGSNNTAACAIISLVRCEVSTYTIRVCVFFVSARRELLFRRPSELMVRFLCWHAGTPGLIKRYPTMPTVSRISFDFLHYIRPPTQATPVPQESFEQLLHFLTSWRCRRTVRCHGGDADSGPKYDNVKDGDVNAGNGDGGSKPVPRAARDGLAVNLLRHFCHVFYFDCNQVLYPGNVLVQLAPSSALAATLQTTRFAWERDSPLLHKHASTFL